MFGQFGIGEIFILFLGGLVVLVLHIFYLLTLQNTLKEVSAENRKIEPNQVWLALIPIFGLIWNFIMVSRIADSLQLEFRIRNIQINEDKPGYTIGLIYSVLFCCSFIPIIGLIAAIVGYFCWIIYWMKINKFKNELKK